MYCKEDRIVLAKHGALQAGSGCYNLGFVSCSGLGGRTAENRLWVVQEGTSLCRVWGTGLFVGAVTAASLAGAEGSAFGSV